MSQQEIFKRGNHANLGRSFERELEATHEWYRAQNLADVIKNPNEWQFVSEKQYAERQKLVSLGKFPAGSAAACDNGRKIFRVKSDVDFSGGGKRFSVMFDAKETSGKNFPLSNIKGHQIQRMVNSSRCGVIAGFMIKIVDRVFFVPASVVRAKENKLLVQRGRRAKPGTASFSIEELEANAVEIPRNRINMLWDWYSVLAKGQ